MKYKISIIFCCVVFITFAQEHKKIPELSFEENETVQKLFTTTEQAQDFANAMKEESGIAKIEQISIENGQFKIENVKNAIAFKNVEATKDVAIDFVATNAIDLEETTFLPNETGDISLLMKEYNEENLREERVNKDDFSITKLYPNPATEFATLKLSSNYINKDVQIKVIDVTGKIVYNATVENNENQLISIPLTDFSIGNYFVFLKTNLIEEQFSLIKK